MGGASAAPLAVHFPAQRGGSGRSSCEVRVVAHKRHDRGRDADVRVMTAIRGGQRWVVENEDRYRAAVMLARAGGV